MGRCSTRTQCGRSAAPLLAATSYGRLADWTAVLRTAGGTMDARDGFRSYCVRGYGVAPGLPHAVSLTRCQNLPSFLRLRPPFFALMYASPCRARTPQYRHLSGERRRFETRAISGTIVSVQRRVESRRVSGKKIIGVAGPGKKTTHRFEIRNRDVRPWTTERVTNAVNFAIRRGSGHHAP